MARLANPRGSRLRVIYVTMATLIVLATANAAGAIATLYLTGATSSWQSLGAVVLSVGMLGCAVGAAAAVLAFARRTVRQNLLSQANAELKDKAEQTAAFEAMKAAKESAERANRTKSEFLATMSHELRTPLNAILGFSEMLVAEVYGALGHQEYRAFAQDIHSSGRHLLKIINDILDLSKVAAGKLELVEDLIDPCEVVNSAHRLIRPRLDDGRLKFSFMAPTAAVMIHADERLLRQMLLNLMSNACKFTPPGGAVSCILTVDETGITFAVVDTGIGIPAEHLSRVLEPFVQVESSLSRTHEGTGLGLPLVKEMAELHGGSFRLESKVGEGTTASIFLPRSRLQDRVSPDASELPPIHANRGAA